MMFEVVATIASGVVLLSILVFFIAIVHNRGHLSSERLWDRLIEKSRNIRLVFALAFSSLMMQLLAETVLLLSVNSAYATPRGVFQIAQTLNVVLMAFAMLAAIPLLSVISGGEEVAT